jgi:hypothetical protein
VPTAPRAASLNSFRSTTTRSAALRRSVARE